MSDIIKDMLTSALTALGSDATYTRAQGGASFTLRVMPARQDDIASFGQTRIHNDNIAILECLRDDLENPARGDEIEYMGDSYLLKTFRVADNEKLLWRLECAPDPA